jgi:peptidoglycan/xylan/chitin deacetylase (PgdA/CDA1 family)
MRVPSPWSVLLSASLLLALVGGASHPAAAADPLVVDIVEPEDGATVSGSVTVRATTGGPAATSVAFDWSDDDGATWTPISTDSNGGNGWSATWNTGSYLGGARLRATATDGTSTAEDSVTVTVEEVPLNLSLTALPNPFSPNGNGMKDTTTFTAVASDPATISFEVLDDGGATVRTFPGVLAATGTRTLVFGGNAEGGGILPAGLYTVEAAASTAGGGSATATAPLRIDLGFPDASWESISPEPISTQSSMSFTYFGWDRAEQLNIELHLYDRVGEVGQPLLGLVRERGTRTLSWAPRYRGGTLLFPGRYRARVRVEDDAGNATWTGYKAWRVHRAVTAKVFRRLNGAGNRVALTFDDCYSWAGWDGVLDVLGSRGVKATFFCSGNYIDDFAKTAQRTRDQGHTIGSHGWDHATMPGRTLADQEQRLRNDQNVWWTYAQETTAPYFRPPYGSYNSTTLLAAGNTAHPRVILWDVDPEDYATSSSSLIASRVLSSVRAGSIVVMHALPQTAGALPAILDGLRNKGLTPVSLATLFREAGYN